jgi:predicted signal transduction protein with EAL and GGDEF domain
MLRLGIVRATAFAVSGAAALAAGASAGALWLAGAAIDVRLVLAAAVGTGALVGAAVWVLLRMLHDLEAARVQLDVLATRDELTGIYNRRQFLVLADREWARCRRYDMGAAMLMLDVDHFKRVNDLHGHLAGDLTPTSSAASAARSSSSSCRTPTRWARSTWPSASASAPRRSRWNGAASASRRR